MDKGLGGFPESNEEFAEYATENYGKFKVPTLRNVDLKPNENFVKSYGHNGYFKALKEIVKFYNTRDMKNAAWPKPEMTENLNTSELGNLGLISEEEDAIVEFMKTLSDTK